MRTLSIVIGFALATNLLADGEAPKETPRTQANDCSKENDKIKQISGNVNTLTEKLAAAETQVKSLETQLQAATSPECHAEHAFSAIQIASKSFDIASDMVNNLLETTDLDNRVIDASSRHFGTAKSLAGNAKEKLTSVDYKSYADAALNFKSHPMYATHVAPKVDTVYKAFEPHVNQYVKPNWEKAMVYAVPAAASVKDICGKATEAVKKDVLPKLQETSSQAYGAISNGSQHIGKLSALLQIGLNPVFGLIAKIAPKREHQLPENPLDRIILLLVIMLLTYHSCKIGARVFMVSLRIARMLLQTIIKYAVILPLKLVAKVLNLFLCVSTGFYCCGLCRRKKAKSNAAESPAKNQKGDKSSKPVPHATAEEVTRILEKAKKEGKLQEGVKMACKLAKEKHPFKAPKDLEGKLLTKDVLVKALGKFKEIEVKKLDL